MGMAVLFRAIGIVALRSLAVATRAKAGSFVAVRSWEDHRQFRQPSRGSMLALGMLALGSAVGSAVDL